MLLGWGGMGSSAILVLKSFVWEVRCRCDRSFGVGFDGLDCVSTTASVVPKVLLLASFGRHSRH